MQTFSNYFHKVSEDHPDETPRSPAGELPKKVAGAKVKELINIVDSINKAVDKVQHDIEQTNFSREEAEVLKDRISALARDLEGTRLPPEAHGVAGSAYTALSGMKFPEHVEQVMREAVGLLKGIIEG